jgi:hypothetical protein
MMIDSIRPQRQAWLAGIALLHLAAMLAWRHGQMRPDPGSAQLEGELILLHTPSQPAPRQATPRRMAPRAPTAPPAPAVVQSSAPAAASTVTPQATTLPATQDDPFAQPAPAPEKLRDITLRAAAGVDRQLRKESLNKFATIVQDQSPLAKKLARAYNGEVVLEQESTMADGRTMKRYRAGGQEWCEYVNLVGAAGQDPFRDGNKYQVKTCP